MRKTWNSVNLTFFVGVVIAKPIFRKTPKGLIIVETRIQIDERHGKTNSKKMNVLIDVVAFSKNALALNVAAQPGAVLYLECHTTNIPRHDEVTGELKLDVKFVADKFQVLIQAPKDKSYIPLDDKTLVQEILEHFGNQPLDDDSMEILSELDPSSYGFDDEEMEEEG